MKFIRYGPCGREKPSLIDDTGRLRDLSAHLVEVDAKTLALASLARLDPRQ